MGSLHIVIELHITFNFYKFELIAQDLCTYSEEIVQEFCYSYVSTLTGSIDSRARIAKKDSLTYSLVQSSRVGVSEAFICRFQYVPITSQRGVAIQ